MARAAGGAITVSSSTRLFAVSPMPSPLPKLRMQRSLSAPASANPGGNVIACGHATDVRSSSVHGCAADKADISSVSDVMATWCRFMIVLSTNADRMAATGTTCEEPPAGDPAVASIADGEPLADVFRCLDFVDKRNRVILHRDPALAILADQQPVTAEPEPSGALAGCELGRRRQEGPIEVARAAQHVEKRAPRCRFRLVRIRKVGRVHGLHAGCHFQRAGTAHDQQPSDPCLPDRRDDRARVRQGDRKSTRLNSSHHSISYAVFCLKKKKNK